MTALRKELSVAPSLTNQDRPAQPPSFVVRILDAKTGPAFMARMAYGHLADQAEAKLRQRWAYYRQRQEADRKGRPFGNAAEWRPLVRAAVEGVRAARAKVAA